MNEKIKLKKENWIKLIYWLNLENLLEKYHALLYPICPIFCVLYSTKPYLLLNYYILLDASPGSYYVEKPLKNMEKQSAFLIHDFFTLSFDNDIF